MNVKDDEYLTAIQMFGVQPFAGGTADIKAKNRAVNMAGAAVEAGNAYRSQTGQRFGPENRDKLIDRWRGFVPDEVKQQYSNEPVGTLIESEDKQDAWTVYAPGKIRRIR